MHADGKLGCKLNSINHHARWPFYLFFSLSLIFFYLRYGAYVQRTFLFLWCYCSIEQIKPLQHLSNFILTFWSFLDSFSINFFSNCFNVSQGIYMNTIKCHLLLFTQDTPNEMKYKINLKGKMKIAQFQLREKSIFGV